jgi:hypothetical protein
MHYMMKSLRGSSEALRVRLASFALSTVITGAVYAAVYQQANLIVA